MTTKNKTLRRFAAGVGAAALALAGVVGAGTVASADVGVGPDQPGAPTKGSLTINKYAGSPTDNPSEENLLDGVEFTVTQVGRIDGEVCTAINLTDAADWDGLTGLFDSAPAAPEGDFCLTDVVRDGTTVDGQVAFTGLPVGIYFVQETDPGANPIVSPVPDFYVSIPTSVDGGGWNYHVVADPKNQLSEAPSKTIAELPDGLVVGSDVTWTLTVPVPTLNNDELFTEAVVTDALDDRLTYVPESSVVTVGGTALVEGTDYNVTGNAVWTLTEAGLEVLDANMGADMTIVFDTTVNTIGDGSIPNAEYESTFNGTTVPGEDVPYTYWGQLEIMKTDDADAPLAGATFEVYEKVDTTCPAEAPATGTVVATGTSDATGVVQWDATDPASSPLGLWIANSDTPLNAPTKDYCVYETAVPAGHTLVPFVNTVTIEAGDTATFELTVENTRIEGPDLPLTGAQGTMALTLGGLLLVGAGAGALVVSRRRNEA